MFRLNFHLNNLIIKNGIIKNKTSYFLAVIVLATIFIYMFFRIYSIPQINLPGHGNNPDISEGRPDTDEPLSLVKINLDQYNLEIDNKTEPILVSEWFKNENHNATLNGSYFEEDFSPSAYLVINKERVGEGYLGDNFTAYLTIYDNNRVEITELLSKEETVKHILQGYPQLIKDSEQYLTSSLEQYSMRSAIGVDDENNAYFIVSNEDFTLLEFTEELLKLDIKFTDVLNLDGGTSSGLYSDIPKNEEQLDSVLRVPNVIYAEEK